MYTLYTVCIHGLFVQKLVQLQSGEYVLYSEKNNGFCVLNIVYKTIFCYNYL